MGEGGVRMLQRSRVLFSLRGLVPRFASRSVSGYRCLSFHLKLLVPFRTQWRGWEGAVCISSSLVAVSFPFLISASSRLFL